ncbi:unnamed protein product [Sphacelaria rigidula]
MASAAAAVAVFMLPLLAAGQDTSLQSCVQSGYAMLRSCPCDGAQFTFSLEGETRIVDNTVDLAIVLDGSGSIDSADFLLEKDFAQNAVAAFANRKLFGNGGTASYVQFSDDVESFGTFVSQADFDAFANGDKQAEGGTDIPKGIEEARRLLNAQAGTAAFMIVITDGNGGDPTEQAQTARDEGTIVFAVGVGNEVSDATLLAIGGEESNVFTIGDFEQLDQALAAILSGAGGSVIPCPSTNAVIVVDFGDIRVSSATTSANGGTAEVSGSMVTFKVGSLEANLAEFTALLDTCAERAGADAVASVSYMDDEGNDPDLSAVDDVAVDSGMCDDPHMVGLAGQKIDWSGVDGAWYSLLSSSGEGQPISASQHATQVNVRVTAPMGEEFPDRQLVTGVSILEGDHSLVVEVKDPYTTRTQGCRKQDARPCLAEGGLHVLVDGVESDALEGPTSVSLFADTDSEMEVTASNLPAECRPFGGDLIWARKFAKISSAIAAAFPGRRNLRSTSAMTFPEWVMSGPPVAAPAWCAQFVKEHYFTSSGAITIHPTGPFALTESNHAVFRIETPSLEIRLNVGTNYQGGETMPDGRVLPELEFWQMNLGIERFKGDHVNIGSGGSLFREMPHKHLSGLLGETARPVVGADGMPVLHGAGAMRGEVENYRVDGPLGTDFHMLHM